MALKYILKKDFSDETVLSERKIYSVSEITGSIRASLEENFTNVWVEGEITGFKSHSSGHFYFSLKDETAQISCVMFRRENQMLSFEAGEGLSVICFGRVSVYLIRGQYQLYVERMEPKGLGALQLRFQKLKEKLKLEGLFDEGRKRPIPFLPKTIGIVTSIDGAALRDILHVLERRFSNVRLLIYPAAVQGSASAPQIVAAIESLNEEGSADVLIVGRGGGSLEDLWAFNEEIVARAIFGSRIPVISAVGQEIDFTIADFVADLRAATPSAAAEMILPLFEDLLARIGECKARITQAVLATLKNERETLSRLKQSRSLRDPLAVFEIQRQRLDELRKNMTRVFETLIILRGEKMASLMGKLDALGPLATLKRGFSVTLKLPGEKIVSSARAVKVGDQVKTKLNRGYFISEIKETHE